MTDDRTLSFSTVTAPIHAPIEKVDIANWIFHLPDAEYQRCAHAHLAAGTTTADDGRAMSINVEMIGDAFVVQHYVAEVREPHFCRMVSNSDSISPVGRTKLQVIWELSVRKIDNDSCEFTNHIHSSATDQTLAFFKEHGIAFERAQAARQQASHAHNQEETPNFANSIERLALTNQQGDISMKTAKELLQAYIDGTAEQAAVLFAERGALELPYLADLGVDPRYEGPKAVGAFLTFLHEKMYPGFKFIDVKIYIDTPDQAFGEYTIRQQSGISGKVVHQRFFGHCTAANGKIVLLREALNVIAAAEGMFPGGIADVVQKRTAKGTPLSDESLRGLATSFIEALRAQDESAFKKIMHDDVIWTLPGTSMVSGVARGVSGILQRAQMIVERGVTLEVMHVVVGYEGAALLLHNTGTWKGKALDEYLTTVCTLRDGKIARLDTYISDIPMVNAYFR